MNHQHARLREYNGERDNKQFTFSSRDTNVAVKQVFCRKIKLGKGRENDQGLLSAWAGAWGGRGARKGFSKEVCGERERLCAILEIVKHHWIQESY